MNKGQFLGALARTGEPSWYSARGSIPSANISAVWQPIGAASLDDSLLRIAGSDGNYTLDPALVGAGVVPGWNASDGWVGNGAKWLRSGINPGGTRKQLTIAVRYSGLSFAAGAFLVGGYDTANNSTGLFYLSTTRFVAYNNGALDKNPYTLPTSGVIIMTPTKLYINGVDVGGTISAGGVDQASRFIDIMGNNGASIATVNIQALAFYKGGLEMTGDQASTLTTDMLALSTRSPQYDPETMLNQGYAYNGAVDGSGVGWAVHDMSDAITASATKVFTCYLGSDNNERAGIKDKATGLWGATAVVGSAYTTSDYSHNYPSMARDSDGYLYCTLGCHNTPVYIKKSTNPDDTSAWGSEVELVAVGSYPKILIDSTDNIYVFWRGGAGTGGISGQQFVKSTDGGATWSSPVLLIEAVSPVSAWVYVGAVALGSDDSLHMVWSYRNANLGGTTQSQFIKVCYMRSTDGGTTWEKSDGTDYTIPVTYASGEDISTTDFVFSHSVKLDTLGSPHAIYVKSDPDVYFTNCHIHYCYLSEGAWQDVELPGQDYGISAHLVISGATFYVFGVQLINAKYEVVQLVSLDSGATWSNPVQLTTNSPYNNLNVVATKTPDNGIFITWAQRNIVYARTIIP